MHLTVCLGYSDVHREWVFINNDKFIFFRNSANHVISTYYVLLVHPCQYKVRDELPGLALLWDIYLRTLLSEGPRGADLYLQPRLVIIKVVMRSWQPGHNSLTSSLLLSWNFEYARGRGMLSRPMLDSGLFLHVSAVSCLMFCYNSGTKAEEMRQSQIQICKML